MLPAGGQWLLNLLIKLISMGERRTRRKQTGTENKVQTEITSVVQRRRGGMPLDGTRSYGGGATTRNTVSVQSYHFTNFAITSIFSSYNFSLFEAINNLMFIYYVD